MKHLSLNSTDCKMWWVAAFLKYGLLRPVAGVLVFLTLVCGDLLCGCASKPVPMVAKQPVVVTNIVVHTSALMPMLKAMEVAACQRIVHSNGVTYIYDTNCNLLSMFPQATNTAYGQITIMAYFSVPDNVLTLKLDGDQPQAMMGEGVFDHVWTLQGKASLFDSWQDMVTVTNGWSAMTFIKPNATQPSAFYRVKFSLP